MTWEEQKADLESLRQWFENELNCPSNGHAERRELMLLRSNLLIADLLMEIAGSSVIQSDLPLQTHETDYR